MKYMILTYASQQDYDGMAGKPTERAGLVGGGLRGHGRVHGVVQQGPGRLRRAGRDAGAGRAGPHPAAPAPARCPGGDRRAVRRDPGGARRLLDRGVRQLRPGDRARRPAGEVPGARGGRGQSAWPTSGRSSTPGPTWSSDRLRARHRGRGPAAAAGAPGPRRGGPALRALRHRRGRHPGGAAGGRHAVAHRWHPGQPARLADHGRLAPAHRPAPQRAGAPAPRGQRRPMDAARAGAGAGRRPAGRPSPTTPSSCCSCAVTPSCRRHRRSR